VEWYGKREIQIEEKKYVIIHTELCQGALREYKHILVEMCEQNKEDGVRASFP
jgi:hypothetical protein